jgi:hypothetical protein
MRKSRRNIRRGGGCGCSTASWFTKGGNCGGAVNLKGGFSKNTKHKKRKNTKTRRKSMKNNKKIGGDIGYYSNSINSVKI